MLDLYLHVCRKDKIQYQTFIIRCRFCVAAMMFVVLPDLYCSYVVSLGKKYILDIVLVNRLCWACIGWWNACQT